jgi:hypothetical protein
MKSHFRFDFTFPRNYEVRVLDSPPLPHPLEQLHHYPVKLEEGDRTGTYLRVVPAQGSPWNGFFALGFESDQVVNAISSCPDADSFCAVVGGYAYVVSARDPTRWYRVEQRPVVELRAILDQKILLFTGFTTISAVGPAGLKWTTQRLSWEGISRIEIAGNKLTGVGWDAMADREAPFEVDLETGRHTGGARPGALPKSVVKT